MMMSIHRGCSGYSQGRKRKAGLGQNSAPPLPDVVFGEKDRRRIEAPHRSALVILVVAENMIVHRVLVEGGSSMNLLPLEAFNKLDLSRNDLKPLGGPLVGLDSHKVPTLGWLEMEIELGRGTPENPETLAQKWRTPFVVVEIEHPYNMLIGQPMLIDIDASTNHRLLQLKVPTTKGVISVQGTLEMAKDCYMAAMKGAGESFQIDLFSLNDEFQSKQTEPVGETHTVEIGDKKSTQVSVQMSEELRKEIVGVLRDNADLFASGTTGIVGVDPTVMSHNLKIKVDTKPVRQKKRLFAPDRQEAIAKEVEKLLDAGFI